MQFNLVRFHWYLAIMLCVAGCNQVESVPANPPAPTPLSLEQWKALPVSEKYDDAFLERLRMGQPELRSDKAWKAYMLKEVAPEMRKDVPSVPAAP